MIFDSLKNAHLYYGLGERVSKALKFLEESDFLLMEPGKYEIDGSNIYAIVQNYDSMPLEGGLWEAHRSYIDIQYVAEGVERIGYANIEQMKISQDYKEAEDYLFLEGEGDFLIFRKGTFMILNPDDVHMPCRAVAVPQPVKKVVVKVLLK